jgi:hypothetical protein
MTKIVKKSNVYEFVETLVDSLYTKEINDIIESDNVQVDKKTFLMFIAMYFSTRLLTSMTKDSIAIFLSDIIRDPVKRRKCIEIFNSFEKVLLEIEFKDTKSIQDNSN